MVYAVQGTFGFRNTARRNAVMSNTQTRIAQEVTWGEVVATAVNPGWRVADPSMVIEVRFATDTARDGFWTDVLEFMGTGVNGPTTGSHIEQHDCPHDQSDPGLCVISERIDF